jgi:hypothetical protein
MFTLKRKARKAQEVDAPTPRSVELWYLSGSLGWVFHSSHSTIASAEAAGRCFTIAKVDIRPIY